jgi:hypothetical protein
MHREIALAPHGERLTVRTKLEAIESETRANTKRLSRNPSRKRASDSVIGTQHWVPWTVTQIPTPTRIAIRIDPATDLPGGHKLMRYEPWESVRRIGDDILLARCPGSHAAKFGCDGDLVVAEIGHYLFVQRRMPDETAQGRHLAGEALQVFATGTAANPAAGMDYCELEFTGKRGQANPLLTVQWDLISWNPTNTDNELAALLRSM